MDLLHRAGRLSREAAISPAKNKGIGTRLSGMHPLHPAVAFLYYTGLGLLCILLFHPLYLALTLCMLLLQVVVHRASAELRRWVSAYFIIAVTILIWNPLFSHRGREILFYIGDIPIVLESVIYGVMMMLLVINVMVLFINYNAVLGSLKFLYLFAKYVPKLAMMSAMAVRFVPLLRKRLTHVIAVQRTRGISMRTGSFKERMKNGIRMLQVVLVWSLDEAMHAADAIAAKGYGTKERSTYERYRMSRLDKLTLLLMFALLGGCIWGKSSGLGSFTVYPSLQQQLMQGSSDYLLLLCYGLYLCIPLLLVWREKRLWR